MSVTWVDGIGPPLEQIWLDCQEPNQVHECCSKQSLALIRAVWRLTDLVEAVHQDCGCDDPGNPSKCIYAEDFLALQARREEPRED